MENTDNQELMDFAKNIVQKLKTIQKHSKDNNIDLKTFLSKKEYKEYQKALAFIKTDVLALKSQSENKEPIDEDISEPAFIDAVLQWRNTLLENLKSTKNQYAQVPIDPNKFSLSIGSNLSALPLNTSLYQEWKSVVEKIPSPSTGAIIFETLIQNSSETWVLTGNLEKLTSHYRKAANKKVYKQYEDTRIDAALPQIALFIAAIKASTDPKDKNLPDNIKAKAEADKAKAEAYKEVLDAWKAEEVANLKFSGHDDTLYVDAITLTKDDGSSVIIHNFPVAEKNALLDKIKKEVLALNQREPSLLDIAQIAKAIIANFHTQMVNKSSIYENLSLKKIIAMKFPTSIDSWILSHKLPEITASKDAKFLAYEKVFDTWYNEEHKILGDTNASEDIRIDPSLLDLKSSTFSNATIPTLMIEELSNNIKKALDKKEKETEILRYNEAALAANDILEAFKSNYNPNRRAFNYKDLALRQIEVLKFPTGIAGWIKEARIKGEDSKDDIKVKIDTELKLVLKNTNNFNLEALIKELKIDMGGITINNDFNFDNDMNLTYNSLSLILKELIKINQAKKTEEKSKIKFKTESANLVIKDFYASYYDSCHYGGSLKFTLDSKEEANGSYTLTFGKKIELDKPNASLLKLYKTVLETIPPIKLKKNENTVIKIDFALSYTYNKETAISKTRENAYTITEVGGNIGAEVSIRFAKLYAGADFKQIHVPQKEGETSTQGTTDKTFTDFYTFEIIIENTENGIELGQGAAISFADSNYVKIAPQLKEKIGLCGNIELQK